MTPELQRLITMHTYQRPAGSRAERKFIRRYLQPLGARVDAFGNWSVVIGDAPRHVWSSHTDTVHKRSGKQRVSVDAHGILSASSGDCLGADDTAGVWLMCELIRRGVAGRYVFHYGEERGCIGSRNLVNDAPDWLRDTDMVIALDRKDVDDIITHQCGCRTASDAFAEALADQLNAGDTTLRYAPSEWGMYTDSESYADTVAECTNLSVGYDGQHSRAETLDTGHALALLARLTVLDISLLPVARKPGETDDYKRATGLHDDTFWNRFEDTTLPVVKSTVSRMYFCPDCGEVVSAHDEDCRYCGYDLDENDPSSYLDGTYADVQAALREDMRRRFKK